jgi:putative alpha-1,2-mannosidase
VQYVQSMHLNGAPLERTWLTGAEVHAGGELSVDLGPHPSDWGRSHLPPSESTQLTSLTELSNPGVKL